MRILWHSNAPWCQTGYGKQTAKWVRLLKSLGHEVAVSAFHGLTGAPITWDGIDVFPAGDDPWGMDIVSGHYRHYKADLLITLQDVWVADPAGVQGLNVAHWVPVDSQPLGAGDKLKLELTGGVPIAMSRFGRDQLEAASFKPLYVPHGIDCEVFRPPEDREALREQFGVADRFVIGINAANQDRTRKEFDRQFRAFARFLKRVPTARLLVHTRANNRDAGGLDLNALAAHCKISANVFFTNDYAYRAGLISDQEMARWYGCLDVLSSTSRAEGFGLPILEAQACGVPAIVSRASSMTELTGAGWSVGGEPEWNYTHEADWLIPDVGAITRAYSKAFDHARSRSSAARAFAESFDVRTVLQEYWVPALAALSSKSSDPTSPAPARTRPRRAA